MVEAVVFDINQNSHSHDFLEIVWIDGRFCVRKTFRSDVARARRSVRKQREFEAISAGLARLSAAEVLDFTFWPGRAELTMPYVEGITGQMFAIHATRGLAQALSASLSGLLDREMSQSKDRKVQIDLFLHKLDEIEKATFHEKLRQKVGNCLKSLGQLPSALDFPIGPCHGDLTLSNIIFHPASGFTLIDFLDTFLETPLQDVAKLNQDFIYGWSLRRSPSALRLKAEILYRHHLPRAISNLLERYPLQIHLLTLMSLARISPYVQDKATEDWLINSLDHCLELFAIQIRSS
jgi:hypothetical protein